MMDNKIRHTTDKVIGSILYPERYANIQKSERIVSAAFGTFMFWKGAKDLFTNPSNGVWELIIGGALLYRGATGYCAVKERIEHAGYDCSTLSNEQGDTELIVEGM
jgi:hypothetical protein